MWWRCRNSFRYTKSKLLFKLFKKSHHTLFLRWLFYHLRFANFSYNYYSWYAETSKNLMQQLWCITSDRGDCSWDLDVIYFFIKGFGAVFYNVSYSSCRYSLIKCPARFFVLSVLANSEGLILIICFTCRALEAKIDFRSSNATAGPYGDFNYVRTTVETELRWVSMKEKESSIKCSIWHVYLWARVFGSELLSFVALIKLAGIAHII